MGTKPLQIAVWGAGARVMLAGAQGAEDAKRHLPTTCTRFPNEADDYGFLRNCALSHLNLLPTITHEVLSSIKYDTNSYPANHNSYSSLLQIVEQVSPNVTPKC